MANDSERASSKDFEAGFTVGMLIGGKKSVLQHLKVEKNGEYKPKEEDTFDGYNKVTVNVIPKETLYITKNGVYGWHADLNGIASVKVEVPGPKIIPLLAAPGKSYNAADYNADGFNPVNVSKSPYEALYKLLTSDDGTGGEAINTGLTDKDGNEITINGYEIDSLSDITGIMNSFCGNDVTVVDVETGWQITIEGICEDNGGYGGLVNKGNVKLTAKNLIDGTTYTRTTSEGAYYSLEGWGITDITSTGVAYYRSGHVANTGKPEYRMDLAWTVPLSLSGHYAVTEYSSKKPSNKGF